MPSAANFSRREAERLAALTFFLDYQIGRYVVAEALRNAGARVEVHIDHFSQAAPDLEWIPEVGRRDWVLITKDSNIRRNPLERSAYKAARLRGSAALWSPARIWVVQTSLVCWLSSLTGMVRRSHGRPGPFLFTVSRGGVFKKLL